MFGMIANTKIKYFLCQTTGLMARPMVAHSATENYGRMIPYITSTKNQFFQLPNKTHIKSSGTVT